jgi:NAD(P)-dependent dehydrogenase (short-subunit alcohol dehydrogenase family)
MTTMVMTGGTSGFGAIAADRLRQSSDVRLILGARRQVPVGEWAPLDLTELESTRAFATSVHERLGDAAIDALVLNAGMILPDVTGRTVDGFETAFAVNHLAHYLLLRLLLPSLADGAIVVLTTSGTHDPDTKAGLAPPRHADADLLAHPDRDPDRDTKPNKAGQHAYTASKLCAVLTARSLSEQPDVRARGIRAVAYCPGQVFGTGLAKSLALPCGPPGRCWALRWEGRCAGSIATSTAARPRGRPWPAWRSASRRPRTDARTPRCDEPGSPGRTHPNWRAATSWRRRSGATAPGWSVCRTEAAQRAGRRRRRPAGKTQLGLGFL